MGPRAPEAGDRKARVAPNRAATVKITGSEGCGCRASTASVPTSTISAATHSSTMVRRA